MDEEALKEKANIFIANADKFNEVVNGSSSNDVTIGDETVPTLAKAISQIGSSEFIRETYEMYADRTASYSVSTANTERLSIDGAFGYRTISIKNNDVIIAYFNIVCDHVDASAGSDLFKLYLAKSDNTVISSSRTYMCGASMMGSTNVRFVNFVWIYRYTEQEALDNCKFYYGQTHRTTGNRYLAADNIGATSLLVQHLTSRV